MADADETSATAAREARDATQAVEGDLKELRPLLESLGYKDELGFLGTFEDRFAEYRKLDEEILPLAVENSNLKAQQLSLVPPGKPRMNSANRWMPQSAPRHRRMCAVPMRLRAELSWPFWRFKYCTRPTSLKPKMPP